MPLDVIPQHSTTLLTVLDEDGTVRYESPSIERIYGYDQGTLVGEQVADYFHPEDRERVVAAYRTVVENDGDTTEAVEYRHLQADGTYRWVESVASADPTPDGFYVVNTRDIAAQKAREQDLKRTNERLERFASVVSHDLRNPLNVAQLRLELARETGDLDHLDEVADSHDRMETLIAKLLQLSRIGNGDPAWERVDLGAVSDRCWDAVPTTDARLEVALDGVVEADRSRLQQLLENLFRNAAEHGDADVTVTVGELDDGSGFYVADDGLGIDAAERDQVFEGGYSTSEDGTGLGLTIVREVADAHGWSVELTASDEGGARVEFTGVEFV